MVGAIAATKAGQLADRGLQQYTTGISLILLILSWVLMAFMGTSIWFLILGIIILDFAVQAVHVTSQSLIFPLRPDAHGRLIASYMIFYSIGSGIGSISSTAIYAWKGWIGVCMLGGAFSLMTLIFWASQLKRKKTQTPL